MSEVTHIKRMKRAIRFWLRKKLYSPYYRRIKHLEGKYKGQRCFLVASGPSLLNQDLCLLKDEFVCVVNASIRAVGSTLPSASMHVVADNNRYRRFASVFEEISAAQNIEHRFYHYPVKRVWDRLKSNLPEPWFFLGHPVVFSDRGAPENYMQSGISSGSTVLVASCQILSWMGFDEIYIMGCDLNYDGQNGPYFYKMTDLDKKHEQDDKVQARRQEMYLVNSELDLAATELSRYGTKLFNAGEGGNLSSLDRVDFVSLFK